MQIFFQSNRDYKFLLMYEYYNDLYLILILFEIIHSTIEFFRKFYLSIFLTEIN